MEISSLLMRGILATGKQLSSRFPEPAVASFLNAQRLNAMQVLPILRIKMVSQKLLFLFRCIKYHRVTGCIIRILPFSNMLVSPLVKHLA